MRDELLGEQAVRVGVVAPLSEPGWTDAGRHLLAGLELGVEELNEQAPRNRQVELLIQDTAADPQKGSAAVDLFAREGVAAVVGEFHSVVARAVATRASQLGLPYLCASAVLDNLTDEPTDWVARLSPPQSRGWRAYADFLIEQGHRIVAVARTASIYWDAGVSVLRGALKAVDGDVVEIDVSDISAAELCERLAATPTSALLLLVGAPEPFAAIVRQVREDCRWSATFLGAPAGQAELAATHAILGRQGAGIPFLQYLPDQLSEAGEEVMRRLRGRLGETPSFVALEGYDAAKVIGELLRRKEGGATMEAVWRGMKVAGSRGLIRFSRGDRVGVWQWDDAPVRIADRDPHDPEMIRARRPQHPALLHP